MAVSSTLIDSFSDNSVDTGRWPNNYFGSATVTEVGGLAVITLAISTAGGNYAGYLSANYDITGSYIFVKIDTTPNQATGAGMYLKLNGTDSIDWYLESNTLYARKNVGGVGTSLYSVAFNSTTHKWWKIRENNGTTYWETSTDGLEWSIRHSVTNPITMTSLKIELGSGTYQSEVAPGAGKFDNFNMVPVNKDGLQAYVGTYTGRTTTGLKEVRDANFMPKLGIFICTGRTSSGSGASSYLSIGIAIGPTISQRAITNTSLNAVGTSDTERGLDATQSVLIANTSGTAIYKSAISSWEADGFTVNDATVDASARSVLYMVLGGNGLGTADQGKFNPSAGTGSKTYSSMAIQPKALLVFGVNTTAYPQANFNIGIGMTSGSGQSGSMATSDHDAQNFSNNRKLQQNSKFFTFLSSTSSTNQGSASLTSFDSAGFTYDVDVANTNDINYLAWSGAVQKVMIVNFGASTGELTITGVGFTPQAMIVLSANSAANAGITDDLRISIGMATGANNQGCVWAGATDNVDTTVVSENLDTTKVIKFMTEAGASPVVVAAASLTTFTDDGCILDRTTADATSREMIIMFIGMPRKPRGVVNYQNPGVFA